MDTFAQLLAESRILSGNYSPATLRGYRFDWCCFEGWCAARACDALPASTETLIAYLTDQLHSRKIVTVARRVAAIRYYHRLAGYHIETQGRVGQLLEGAQRIRAERPSQKKAITVEELALMCRQAAGFPACVARNRSILTLGYATALRRSSLVGLDLDDVRLVREGFTVHVAREKQDQQAKGRNVGVPFGQHMDTCPVAALTAWLRFRGDGPGPLFLPVVIGKVGGRRLHPGAIARIVKEAGARIGIAPERLGGHSLRSGMITESLLRGIDAVVLAAHTGHRSLSSLQRYYRASSVWERNPGSLIGL